MSGQIFVFRQTGYYRTSHFRDPGPAGSGEDGLGDVIGLLLFGFSSI
jgi:hypothetical protein